MSAPLNIDMDNVMRQQMSIYYLIIIILQFFSVAPMTSSGLAYPVQVQAMDSPGQMERLWNI